MGETKVALICLQMLMHLEAIVLPTSSNELNARGRDDANNLFSAMSADRYAGLPQQALRHGVSC
jgi:hypothetical protein